MLDIPFIEERSLIYMTKEQPASEFGKRLIKELERIGATQSDAAEWAGVDKSAVSRWISGKSTPRRRNIAPIAKRLGRSEEYLLSGSRTAPQEGELVSKIADALLSELYRRNIQLAPNEHGNLISIAYRLALLEDEPEMAIKKVAKEVADILEISAKKK